MVDTPRFPRKHQAMVGRSDHPNRDPDVQIPTEAKKPQTTSKILE
jgi:hypothetical protein